jgi:biotin transport system permease protein
LVGLEKGSFNSIVILSGLLIATLVTMTTKTTEIVNLIKRLTRSENFALLIGLSINSIAVVGSIAAGIVEAGKARGVRPSTVRQLTNLFVVSLKQADDYAEALAATGVQV